MALAIQIYWGDAEHKYMIQDVIFGSKFLHLWKPLGAVCLSINSTFRSRTLGDNEKQTSK